MPSKLRLLIAKTPLFAGNFSFTHHIKNPFMLKLLQIEVFFFKKNCISPEEKGGLDLRFL